MMKPIGKLQTLRNTVAFLTLSLASLGFAQDGYRYSQDNSSTPAPDANAGPVRMARISYIQGSVTWRPNDSVDWSEASSNLPLRQGAQIWVSNGSKAEVQFDDGSRLRLGTGSVAVLQTLYSDDKGEFSEIKLNSGLASLSMTNKDSQYQVDTPLASVKASGPSRIRVGAGSDVEVAVRRGQADVEGNQGHTTLYANEYLDIPDDNSQFDVRRLPNADSWDQFSDSRDNMLDHPSQYVPNNIGIVSGDLEDNGYWRPNPHYGHVWYPRVRYAGWRPYHDGHWVWMDPFGWTWVADESWGWAPYHYGTWIHDDYGWGWCPGPRRQYWSPAVVSFSTYNGAVAWCPLAPREVCYPPALTVGFGRGNWFFSFSIGGAACYYPEGRDYCVARPWHNTYINRTVNVYNVNRVTNIYNNNTYITNSRFVPTYGRSSFAITRTTTAGFNGRGRFQSGTASDVSIFQRGRGFAAPRGQAPIFGPASVRPTLAAITPGRTFSTRRPDQRVMERTVFRSRLPVAIAKTSGPIRTNPSRLGQPTRGFGQNPGGTINRGTATTRSNYGSNRTTTRPNTGGYGRPGTTRGTTTQPSHTFGGPTRSTGSNTTRTGSSPTRGRDSGSFGTSTHTRGTGSFGTSDRARGTSTPPNRSSGSFGSSDRTRGNTTPPNRSSGSFGSADRTRGNTTPPNRERGSFGGSDRTQGDSTPPNRERGSSGSSDRPRGNSNPPARGGGSFGSSDRSRGNSAPPSHSSSRGDSNDRRKGHGN